MEKDTRWYVLSKKQRVFYVSIAAIALLIVIMTSIWTIDIAVSAMIIQPDTTTNISLTNGFFIRDPMKAYHMGLWGVIMGTFLFVMLMMYVITRIFQED
jgi:hypothetical protein